MVSDSIRYVIAVVTLGWSVVTLACGGSDDTEAATVARVIDGDTIELDDGRKVRFIGIDAPEDGVCGAYTATEVVYQAIWNRPIELVNPESVRDEDRYGRLLRYVEFDHEDVGGYLVQSGLAVARYDSRDGYGRHPREDEYVAMDELSPNVCG